jgi:hypothetical protein
MKTIFVFALLLILFNAGAQEMVTLKFVRPAKFQGSAAKIKIQLLGNEYVVKNGADISVNVPLEYYKTTRIDCRYGLGQSKSIYLRPKPDQVYQFEVGFEFKGMYIRLISGEEASADESATTQDSVLVDGKWEKQTIVEKDNLAIGFTSEKVDESEALRQEWLARGGKIKNESVTFLGSYFRLNFGDQSNINGYGGGISASQNWLNLKIPEYKVGISTWNSLNYGWGFDMLLYTFNFSISVPPYTMETDVLSISYPIYGNIGYTFGVGKFLDKANWKGVALTIKYRPSIMLNMMSIKTKTTPTNSLMPETTTTDTDAQFNAGGFGFDFEFSNFSATMNKLAPKPKTKFSFFMLPPIGDNPLFI